MSRRRIYFASFGRLRGYDLLSGEQIYSVRFEDEAPQAGRSSPPTMPDFYLLHDGQSELVLITQRHYKSVTITILNGDDGDILQQVDTECWPNPHVLVPWSRMAFVVVSYKGPPELHYKMQTFSPSRDGLFTERTIDTFTLDFRLTRSYLVAVNPVWNVVAYHLEHQSIPAVCRLSSDLSSDNAPPNSLENSTNRNPAEPVGDRLHPSNPQQLTLPPRYSHKTRRPYVLESQFYYPSKMRFVDGDRLLFVPLPHKSGAWCILSLWFSTEAAVESSRGLGAHFLFVLQLSSRGRESVH
ncbi:hypothetical protein ASPCAL14446 [Aspergillus calidoustus]|uniref:Uncharacterized protein n=1 Tax=Aspergillus calidoustus TaxID=454130 RepID=A0A0U5GMX5_ASPCI|nr:hypothetical protein ASPCAL14446 [Aspergillus calidoustus]